MALNRDWHAVHRLARGASMEELLAWHLAHAVRCGCREMPAEIRRELERRGVGPAVAAGPVRAPHGGRE